MIPTEFTENGIIEFNRDNISEALSLFEKALELKPNAIMALHYRGMCKCLLAENQEQLTDAISDLKRVAELLPQVFQIARDSLTL